MFPDREHTTIEAQKQPPFWDSRSPTHPTLRAGMSSVQRGPCRLRTIRGNAMAWTPGGQALEMRTVIK